MNIEEFRRRYATNRHREYLFSEFKEYLDHTSEFLLPYNVLVFGSFVTVKENPSDVDILVHGYVKDCKIDEFDIRSFQTKGYLHIKLEISAMKQTFKLRTCREIVEWFEESEKNKNRSITVGKYECIDF